VHEGDAVVFYVGEVMLQRVSILLTFGLAACGGGGGGSAFVDPTGPTAMLDLYDEANTIAAGLPNTVPTSSSADSADFSGAIVLAESTPGDSYISSLTMSVNFAGDSLTGDTGQFYYYDTSGENGTVGVAVAGDLDLAASSLAYSGTSFTTTITGSLDNEDDVTRTITTGSTSTVFAGLFDDVTHVTGVGSTTLDDATELDVAFIVEALP